VGIGVLVFGLARLTQELQRLLIGDENLLWENDKQTDEHMMTTRKKLKFF